jgi:hypothetical protein
LTRLKGSPGRACSYRSEIGGLIMNQGVRRNRLLPWFIGIAIVVLGELYVAYEMFFRGSAAPSMPEVAVLIIIPAVYLTLMYLTFISQD